MNHYSVPEGALVPTTITMQFAALLPADLPQLPVHQAEERG